MFSGRTGGRHSNRPPSSANQLVPVGAGRERKRKAKGSLPAGPIEGLGREAARPASPAVAHLALGAFLNVASVQLQLSEAACRSRDGV